ncbi:MAG TPA: hypothetical protein VGW37_06435 [Terriglobia bacterium]|nr:hypothetical protein [Terriglobia bacterium]
MTQSKPPALASWMLSHLMWGGRNEALAGDLLEEFQRRRSVAWYWRQVISAIFASFANELRADWVMVWTILFTTVWAYSLYAIPIIAWPVPISLVYRLDHYLTAHGYYGTFIWYLASDVFLYAIPFLLRVVAPLGIYLAGARRMNIRAFISGVCAAVLLAAVLAMLPFQPVLDFLSLHGLAMYWAQLWKWYEVMVMYQFIPLIAAMWIAQARRRSTPPRVIAT